jgi:hypothetical protein
VRYFEDKAVDPPKRRIHDRKDKAPDIPSPVHACPDNGVCDICRDGGSSDRHYRRHGRVRNEGTGE